MARSGVISDELWVVIEPVLPNSFGRRGRPWRDHREVLEAICWRYRVGAPWRDLPAEFPPWQTVWKRHFRWSSDGTYDRLFQAVRGAGQDIDAELGALSWIHLSKEGKGTAGPLVTALTAATVEAAEELATAQPGGRLATPLLGVLDEAANVCRWHDLPDLYSHYGSRGIVLMTILQSWSQGVQVWGRDGMRKLWSASNIAVYGGRGEGTGVSERTVSDGRRLRQAHPLHKRRPGQPLHLSPSAARAHLGRCRPGGVAARPRSRVRLRRPRDACRDRSLDAGPASGCCASFHRSPRPCRSSRGNGEGG